MTRVLSARKEFRATLDRWVQRVIRALLDLRETGVQPDQWVPKEIKGM